MNEISIEEVLDRARWRGMADKLALDFKTQHRLAPDHHTQFTVDVVFDDGRVRVDVPRELVASVTEKTLADHIHDGVLETVEKARGLR